jgi:hypothetical protein
MGAVWCDAIGGQLSQCPFMHTMRYVARDPLRCRLHAKPPTRSHTVGVPWRRKQGADPERGGAQPALLRVAAADRAHTPGVRAVRVAVHAGVRIASYAWVATERLDADHLIFSRAVISNTCWTK